jgi:dienelactone hydrolase
MQLSALILTLSSTLAAPEVDLSAAIAESLGGTEAQKMMSVYLDRDTTAHIEARKVRYEALKTPEEIVAYQRDQRDYFVEHLGGFPERTLLNPQLLGGGEGDGFRYERVIYESRPDFHVPALLFLPLSEGPHPGVLIPCGHVPEGKGGTEYYQWVAMLLARNGIVALLYDPIGQGERIFYYKDDNTSEVGSTAEHTLLGVGAILTGTSIAQYRIWDGMRGIDYLQTRPEVDKERIGVTGISGGGTLTSYIMALDDRVDVAAPACFITSMEWLVPNMGPQDGEQNTYGQLKQGIEHADFVHMRAPKPTLLLTTTRDAFHISGSWDSYREAKRLYTRLGFPERVDLIEADDVHAYNIHLREGMVSWMRRWLMDIDEPVREVTPISLTPEQYICTPEGQVYRMEGAKSVIDFNVERASSLREQRERFWAGNGRATTLDKVRELAAIRPLTELPAVTKTVLEQRVEDGHVVYYVLLHTDDGIALPAKFRLPEHPNDQSAVHLVFPGDGLGSFEEILAGHPQKDNDADLFIAVALRGTGVTQSQKYATGGWNHVASDFQDIFRAYLNARSYAGMRAEEIMQIVALLRTDPEISNKAAVNVYATGEATVPALHAAALAPDIISSTTLVRGIPSWEAAAAETRASGQLVNAVHNALAWYDLPMLAGTLPEGKVTMVDMAVPVF